jgi:predicted TPR repeat methyltransferase
MNMDPEVLFSNAHELQREGQLPEAIRCYEQLLILSPNHVEALRFIALAYAQLDDMHNTVLYLKRALDLQPTDARLHNNIANAYKKSLDYDKAIYHYQQALQFDPDYAQAHNNLATVYALQEEYQQALHHYRLAVHAEPDFTAAHYNLGLLFLKNNQLEPAKIQFTNVLTLNPGHVDAQFYIGILLLEANALEKAEEAFQNVLITNSEHVEALINLGVIALKHEHGQIAVDYFTRALALDNDNVDARNNLAATFIHNDRFENALIHYTVLLQHDPHHIEYLYNAGVAQMALGHLKEATTLFEAILTQQDDHFAALTNLAAIHIRLGKRDEAIVLLEHALVANPKDDATQFMLNALTGCEKKPDACPTYVSNLFNNYALYYDQHVQGPLHYSLPHIIGRALHQLNCTKVLNAIDLGCGTGLSGVVLRELSEHLTGVDIAAKMLSQARAKGIYDQLIESELITFLQQDKQHYELAVAADVLPYIGELDTLFSAVNQHLTHEGLFIFTHEISENQPWKLQDSARFSHHPDYIKTLCDQQNFHIIYQEKVVARQQNGQALHVMLYFVQPTFEV